jgi:hypothetical protein
MVYTSWQWKVADDASCQNKVMKKGRMLSRDGVCHTMTPDMTCLFREGSKKHDSSYESRLVRGNSSRRLRGGALVVRTAAGLGARILSTRHRGRVGAGSASVRDIMLRPEHAGHAMHTIFVDDLDALVERLADRGLDPAERETYTGGVRKITYRDPDGNEIGLGGAPL